MQCESTRGVINDARLFAKHEKEASYRRWNSHEYISIIRRIGDHGHDIKNGGEK